MANRIKLAVLALMGLAAGAWLITAVYEFGKR
jgi:hypothetical protein